MITFDETMRASAYADGTKQMAKIRRGNRDWTEEVHPDDVAARGPEGALAMTFAKIFERIMQDALPPTVAP